jgi:hypothetical protein
MAKNGPCRNGTPPKTWKTGPKDRGFWSILAKESRCALHLALIFELRDPRVGDFGVAKSQFQSRRLPDSVFGPTLPLSLVWLAMLAWGLAYIG